jgi:C1A family cysteine protease
MNSILIIFLILKIIINSVLGMPIDNNINYSIYGPQHLKNQSQMFSTDNYQFTLYQNQLTKNYGLTKDKLYDFRLNNFIKNNEKIMVHNIKNITQWNAFWTSLSDLSIIEYYQLFLTEPKQYSFLDKSKHIRFYYFDDTLTFNNNNIFPNLIDWRTFNMVSPVKNQILNINNTFKTFCSSSWAFSAIGSLEGQIAKLTGKLESISVQNILDCADYNIGCYGSGYPNLGLNYIKTNGFHYEETYSYTGIKNYCGMMCNIHINNNIKNIHFKDIINIKSGDTNGLLHALTYVGPVSAIIKVDEDFINYSGGVYNLTKSTLEYNTLFNLSVLVIGYGMTIDKIPYYIIKNSWGTQWGMDGYFYWNRSNPNMGGIANYVSFPLIINV